MGPFSTYLIFLYYRIFQDSEASQWHDLQDLIDLQAEGKAESELDNGYALEMDTVLLKYVTYRTVFYLVIRVIIGSILRTEHRFLNISQ